MSWESASVGCPRRACATRAFLGGQWFYLKSKIMKGKGLPAFLKRSNLSLFSKNLPQTNFLTNKIMCVCVHCFQRTVFAKGTCLEIYKKNWQHEAD